MIPLHCSRADIRHVCERVGRDSAERYWAGLPSSNGGSSCVREAGRLACESDPWLDRASGVDDLDVQRVQHDDRVVVHARLQPAELPGACEIVTSHHVG